MEVIIKCEVSDGEFTKYDFKLLILSKVRYFITSVFVFNVAYNSEDLIFRISGKLLNNLPFFLSIFFVLYSYKTLLEIIIQTESE